MSKWEFYFISACFLSPFLYFFYYSFFILFFYYCIFFFLLSYSFSFDSFFSFWRELNMCFQFQFCFFENDILVFPILIMVLFSIFEKWPFYFLIHPYLWLKFFRRFLHSYTSVVVRSNGRHELLVLVLV